MRTIIPGVFFAAGFGPIAALALFIIGVAPLPVTALAVIAPMSVLAISLGVRNPAWGHVAIKGLLIGLAGVTTYDLFRMPLVQIGLWPDFIPRIGGWLVLSDTPNAAVGYVYRYLGDGAGMGMSFVAAYSLARGKLPAIATATAFGVGIWLCLIATLIIAPHGQELMFRITPTSLALSLIGHVIYGATIGYLVFRFDSAIYADATLAVLDGRMRWRSIPRLRQTQRA
ncbi:MAG TPA: hypothetical protein VFO25_05430 [Candidatus Eremiobacteraceae bacterium]|nr:hypothetical protein [Candidatus Eremiobacteraceae bacterium]